MTQQFQVSGSVTGNTEPVKVGVRKSHAATDWMKDSNGNDLVGTVPIGGGPWSFNIDTTAAGNGGMCVIVKDADNN